MAAKEKLGEAAREAATADQTHQWAEPERSYREGKPYPARLARLLSEQSPDWTETAGRLAATATSSAAAQAAETSWLRNDPGRPPSLAEPLGCGTGAVQSRTRLM